MHSPAEPPVHSEQELSHSKRDQTPPHTSVDTGRDRSVEVVAGGLGVHALPLREIGVDHLQVERVALVAVRVGAAPRAAIAGAVTGSTHCVAWVVLLGQTGVATLGGRHLHLARHAAETLVLGGARAGGARRQAHWRVNQKGYLGRQWRPRKCRCSGHWARRGRTAWPRGPRRSLPRSLRHTPCTGWGPLPRTRRRPRHTLSCTAPTLADATGPLVLVGVALGAALVGGDLEAGGCARGAGVVVAGKGAPVTVASAGLAHIGHGNVVGLASGLTGVVRAEVGDSTRGVTGGALGGQAACALQTRPVAS